MAAPGELLSALKRNSTIKRFYWNRYLYILILPVLAHNIIFNYFPMYGVIIAFKDFRASLGILGSPWIGFRHFEDFFSSIYFWRLLRNTFMINLYQLIFAFPAPIILALLLNEIKRLKFRRFVQTSSYLPYFISVVIVAGFIHDFFGTSGAINQILSSLFKTDPIPFLSDPKYFRALYVGSDIWQGVGFGSIIFLAAISSIDVELYEAAIIDGAGRLKRVRYITIPCIAPTIIILLIFNLGGMLSLGFHKILLLYNPLTYETADVISTFVYRRGLMMADYSYASAIGLFNSVVAMILIAVSNQVSKKVSETSLW